MFSCYENEDYFFMEIKTFQISGYFVNPDFYKTAGAASMEN